MAISASVWGRVGTPPIDTVKKRELYIHHTVTSDDPRTREEERAHMRQLEQFHLDRGFTTIGYNYVCFRSGRLYEGRGLRGLPAAQGGHNSGTWACAYVADLTTDKMTLRAKLRIILLAVRLRVRRGCRFRGGHREAPNLRESTACPEVGGLRFVRGSLRKSGLAHISTRFTVAADLPDEPLEGDTGSVCE